MGPAAMAERQEVATCLLLPYRRGPWSVKLLTAGALDYPVAWVLWLCVYFCFCVSVHMSAAAHRGQKRAPEFLDVITGSGEPMWELAIELRPSASTVYTFNARALYLSSTVSW